MMPVGVLVNALSVLVGGLCGSTLKDRLSDSLKSNINNVLGLCSMGMGVSAIVLMQNMPAVIFALILGTTLGILTHLGAGIRKLAEKAGNGNRTESEHELYVTAAVLFCASGTGIYGALTAGMSNDMSILLSKSILDFCTAAIFACTLGRSVSKIAIPQFCILYALYLLAGLIVPYTTPVLFNDFKACGGFIMLATGFRMLNLKMFPIADMIPAMILVMPLSALWMNVILPLI